MYIVIFIDQYTGILNFKFENDTINIYLIFNFIKSESKILIKIEIYKQFIDFILLCVYRRWNQELSFKLFLNYISNLSNCTLI